MKKLLFLLFLTTSSLIGLTSQQHQEKKIQKENENKDESCCCSLRRFATEYWFPIYSAIGGVLVYESLNDKKHRMSKFSEDYIPQLALLSASAIYAVYFFAGMYVDRKITRSFLSKKEKAINDIIHDSSKK